MALISRRTIDEVSAINVGMKLKEGGIGERFLEDGASNLAASS